MSWIWCVLSPRGFDRPVLSMQGKLVSCSHSGLWNAVNTSERRTGERSVVAMVTSPVHRDLMLLQTEDELARGREMRPWKNLWPQALSHPFCLRRWNRRCYTLQVSDTQMAAVASASHNADHFKTSHIHWRFGQCFPSLGEEKVGVIWSYNLLEIYQSEINFISSHTESVSQLNLCPATFRVPVSTDEGQRAGWTAGRLSYRQQRPKYLINKLSCHSGWQPKPDNEL